MIRLAYEIELTSDAEPGSGLGSETINALVPRDASGRTYLPASHIKGLMRARIEDIGAALDWPGHIDVLLFGEAGQEGSDGIPGSIQVTDASEVESSATLLIARTSVGDLGTAVGTTLRTVEALRVGGRYRGSVGIDDEIGGPADLGARLALLSIEAVGGGRTRGAGACKIAIDGENRTPGVLLRAVNDHVTKGIRGTPLAARQPKRQPAGKGGVLLSMVFRSDGAVCCPETPVVSNNVIRSGFAIPASAVQGALLTWLDRIDSALATACFEDPQFRAWPLLPCGAVTERELPEPVHVSLTHRMSKLPVLGDAHDFRDTAIEPYDWREVAAGSPLKAADGVLLRRADGRVALWRAVDIPRLFTAHGVHHDPTGQGQRNLFTVESMAPLAFRGLVHLPVDAANALIEYLQRHPDYTLALGKSRSVRGGGKVALAAGGGVLEPAPLANGKGGTLFIVQSPLAIPDDWNIHEADAVLIRLVEAAGWGKASEDTSATLGVRFGWNRQGVGTCVGDHRRLRARRVVLPGSVIVLESPLSPEQAREALLRGIGEGREQGFGAVLPHPGTASDLHRRAPEVGRLRSRDAAGLTAVQLWRQAGDSGPSASQVSALARRVAVSPKGALDYVRRQVNERPDRTYRRWKNVFADVERLIQEDPALALRVLRTWQDLVVAHGEGREAGK
jgi:hypothetical protein